jgi:hypothetical protein
MRAQWRIILQGSQQEALLAVNLYNEAGQPRRLEAFFIHMHLAWLYLLHARFHRDHIDYHYRLPNGRFLRVDGEPKTWELARCLEERWPTVTPVRKNLELTVALRNKIEHRYEEAIAQYVAGYSQALLLNYEEETVQTFGTTYSLAQRLRFPVFLSALTPEGLNQTMEAHGTVPSQMRGFIAAFESGLDASIASDHRYEFRVHLVPKLSPKTEADMAITFVREEELTEVQRHAFLELGKAGRVIVRERLRDVRNLGLLKPGKAAQLIESQLPFRFSVYGPFPKAWKKLKARPSKGVSQPERTDERYCIYDEAHGDYLYTQAFVAKVVRDCSTRSGYKKLIGLSPKIKQTRRRNRG